MRIAVQHHTTKDMARKKVEQRLDQLLGQFGAKADEIQHDWTGDTLHFKGKARGMTLEGTLEITATDVILDAKLPLLARAFEPRIRAAVEKEADSMFRMA